MSSVRILHDDFLDALSWCIETVLKQESQSVSQSVDEASKACVPLRAPCLRIPTQTLRSTQPSTQPAEDVEQRRNEIAMLKQLQKRVKELQERGLSKAEQEVINNVVKSYMLGQDAETLLLKELHTCQYQDGHQIPEKKDIVQQPP